MATSEHSRSFRCPICGKPTDINSEIFPFCTTRCQLVDLNRWLEGRYTVTSPLDAQETHSGPESVESPVAPTNPP
ncbi:MAG: DNA gyrase inhibitor YacG [Phycisphaerae bacterium]